MTISVLGLLFILIIVVLSLVGLARRAPIGAYRLRKPLSAPEQTLYWRLVQALPECVVLSQVSFSRFLEPDARGRGARLGLFNRISRKSTDFLVCLKDFTVVAAVELDDRTHVRERDARRDAMLGTAGVKVVRMHVRDIPSVEQIRAIFER